MGTGPAGGGKREIVLGGGGKRADNSKVMRSPPIPMLSAAVVAGGLMLAGLGQAGCATAGRDAAGAGGAAPTVRAEVAIENVTPYAWEIAVLTRGGAPVETVQVGPRETVPLELAGGAYVIEQRLRTGPAMADATRRIEATFEAGAAYVWPLATLRSAGEAGASGP